MYQSAKGESNAALFITLQINNAQVEEDQINSRLQLNTTTVAQCECHTLL